MTGPKPTNAKVRLGLTSPSVKVRVNNVETGSGRPMDPIPPGPNIKVYEYTIPADILEPGKTVIEVTAQAATRIEWVELV